MIPNWMLAAFYAWRTRKITAWADAVCGPTIASAVVIAAASIQFGIMSRPREA